jgi:hypothetical protein
MTEFDIIEQGRYHRAYTIDSIDGPLDNTNSDVICFWNQFARWSMGSILVSMSSDFKLRFNRNRYRSIDMWSMRETVFEIFQDFRILSRVSRCHWNLYIDDFEGSVDGSINPIDLPISLLCRLCPVSIQSTRPHQHMNIDFLEWPPIIVKTNLKYSLEDMCAHDRYHRYSLDIIEF